MTKFLHYEISTGEIKVLGFTSKAPDMVILAEIQTEDRNISDAIIYGFRAGFRACEKIGKSIKA